MSKPARKGTPDTLGECETGMVVEVAGQAGPVRVTGHLARHTLIERPGQRSDFCALPSSLIVVRVLFESGHVKQGNQGDVDPVGGGR